MAPSRKNKRNDTSLIDFQDEVSSAYKLRKTERARADLNLNELKDELQSVDKDLELIETLLERLEISLSKLIESDSIIQSELDSDKMLSDMKESESIIKSITKQIKIAQKTISSDKPDSDKSSCCDGNRPHNYNNSYIRPKLDIPQFSGNILEFKNFWDVYNAAIADNPPNITKIRLLVSRLTGNAKRLIEGFGISADNYQVVVDTLKAAYDNPVKIIETLILKIINLPEPKYSYEKLYAFKSEICYLIESLKRHNIVNDCKGCSTILGTILIYKFPRELKSKMNWEKPKTAWTLELLKECLDQALASLEAEEYSSNSQTTSNSNKKETTKPSKNTTTEHETSKKEKSHATSTVLAIQSSTKGKEFKYPCIFCNVQNHYPSECKEYTTSEARLALAKYKNVCIRCFSKHSIQQCQSDKLCFKCKSPHHPAFCDKPSQPNVKTNTHVNSSKPKAAADSNHNINTKVQANETEVQEETSNLSVNMSQTCTGVALPIAECTLISDKRRCNARVLFDGGSQTSIIERSIVDQLKLTPHKTISRTITGINGISKRQNYDIVSFAVFTKDGDVTINAMVLDHLPQNIYIPGLTKTTAVLRNLNVSLANPNPPSDSISDIRLLIGADNYDKFVYGPKSIKGVKLLESNVGNLITGELPIKMNSTSSYIGSLFIYKVAINDEVTLSDSQPCFNKELEPNTDNPSEDLSKLWSLSHIGISPEESLTPAENSALKTFENSVKLEDGKYVVSLPWREQHKPLPDNYGLAKSRLFSIMKKLRENPELLESYNSIIQEQLERDFIEKVSPYTLHPEAILHYLPHHFVRKASNTTALRIVYDCSSNNPSLNDCLWSGPSLSTDLNKLLLAFRLKPFAISADLEKAFLGIRLSEKDRDSVRFLWFEDPFDPKSQILTYRFKSVLFGSTASPFLLAACLKRHIELSNSRYKTTLFKQIYVDNIFANFDEDSEIKEFFQDTRDLFNQAGLNLREWTSNSSSANKMFEEQNLGISDSISKVLGMTWDTESDVMGYPDKLLNFEATTKRSILKTLASVFDPLGILSPVTLRGRTLLQSLWKSKLGWDEKIPIATQKEWRKILAEIKFGSSLFLPRQLIFSTEVVIHAFSDASNTAYSSVIYIVSEHNGENISNIIMAKSRVAPLKTLTIPKLELMGMVLSSRLINHVLDAYKELLTFKHIYCWSDSQTAIQWLFSQKQLPTFVQNRVEEIRTQLPEAKWKYVSTNENPSDKSSRGSNSKYIFSDLWLHGPSWLTKPNLWPTWSEHPSCTEIPDNQVTLTASMEPIIEVPIKIEDFSSLKRLLKVTALVLRFVKNLKNKINKSPLQTTIVQTDKYSHNFSKEELNNAEQFWIKIVQREFKEEFASLQFNCASSKVVNQFNLILVDGFIRCDRRLKNSTVSPEAKYPLFLSKSHPFTALLIRHQHLTHHHVSISQLIGHLRQKYYFPRMRQTVKRVVRPCVFCKRLQGSHYPQAPLSALPSARITETRAFSIIGVDYTGFFNVKVNNNVEKSYIILFTCAVTRAVHLELAFDNSTNSFLKAFRRFIGRRGRPSIIYSDNASYFKAASEFLQSLSKLSEVEEFLKDTNIIWRFNPARASFFGGFFERLIGLVKVCLKRTLATSLVTWEEFYTIITEVELTLNCRPLTYVGDDLKDDDPLTPAHLLTGYNLKGLPIPESLLDKDENFNDPNLLSKRHKRVLTLIRRFWNIWERDYLLQLRQSWNKNGHPNIKEGDIVLVENDGPRLKWKLGIVRKLHESSDGYTRSVTLKTKHGDITRATIQLYPLEIHSNIHDSNDQCRDKDIGTRREFRKANLIAKKRIKEMLR